MYTFPVIRSLDKLPAYFEAIKIHQVPQKFTYRFFSTVCEFTSSQDRDFVGLLKFLGFISSDGVPTAEYATLRDASAFQSALLSRIQLCYSAILVSDKLTHDLLLSEFIKHTLVSLPVAEVYTTTLLALLDLSGYTPSANVAIDSSVSGSSSINLTLNLPTTTDKSVYNSLFEALFKYLKV